MINLTQQAVNKLKLNLYGDTLKTIQDNFSQYIEYSEMLENELSKERPDQRRVKSYKQIIDKYRKLNRQLDSALLV